MKFETRKALGCAVDAARRAGALMRRNRSSVKIINEQSQHDIKLELDVRCQKLIERALLAVFPDSAVLGEEGVAGNGSSALRWVVDPIDGTVNFTYGVPHACVSIALQQRANTAGEFVTVLGVVYDPFCEELWTAAIGGPARLNGKIIHASRRKALEESIVAIGFSKIGEKPQRKSARLQLPGPARPQNPHDGRRRPFAGLRGFRTVRRLHRIGRLAVGHCRCGIDPGMCRRGILAAAHRRNRPVPDGGKQRPAARKAREDCPRSPQMITPRWRTS